MKPCRIVIIAKLPLAGYAKTRLSPALGEEGAARLAGRMLHHTVRTTLAAQIGPVELCAAPTSAHPGWKALALPGALDWSDQGEGDLGQRMARAAARTLAQGETLLLIGTDCPALTSDHLRTAAAALGDQHEALIPTFDGGYALLGLAEMTPSVFIDMPWSTADVAHLTLKRLSAAGRRVQIGPTLHDIDEPADLVHLPPALQQACASQSLYDKDVDVS